MKYLIGFLIRDKAAILGFSLFAVILFCAIGGGYIVPYPEDAFDAKPWQRMLPPSAEHILGTDGMGRISVAYL